jgi:hypothetical protein
MPTETQCLLPNDTLFSEVTVVWCVLNCKVPGHKLKRVLWTLYIIVGGLLLLLLLLYHYDVLLTF